MAFKALTPIIEESVGIKILDKLLHANMILKSQYRTFTLEATLRRGTWQSNKL